MWGSWLFFMPGGTENLSEGRHHLHRGWVFDPIPDGLTLAAGRHDPLVAKHGKVLRKRGLRQADFRLELPDRAFSLRQPAQDHQAPVVAECA